MAPHMMLRSAAQAVQPARRKLDAIDGENELDDPAHFTMRKSLQTDPESAASGAPARGRAKSATRSVATDERSQPEETRDPAHANHPEKRHSIGNHQDGHDDNDTATGNSDGVAHNLIPDATNQAQKHPRQTINSLRAFQDTTMSRQGSAAVEGLEVEEVEEDDGDDDDNDNDGSFFDRASESDMTASDVNTDQDGVERALGLDVAEDSAFIDPPLTSETLVLVKATINNFNGISKTLQHRAWTNSRSWVREFESNDKSGQIIRSCKTSTGKMLMRELEVLMQTLYKAVDARQQSLGNVQDFTQTIEWLRANNEVCKGNFARIDQAVENICSREIAAAAGNNLAGPAIRTKCRLLHDTSRRLVPMLVLAAKKACDLGPSENGASKISIWFNCFTLQFFWRTVAWAKRLQKALKRGLGQWPSDEDFQQDLDGLLGDGVLLKQSKIKHDIFEGQLGSLYSAAEKATKDMQDALQGQRREPEDKQQNGLRRKDPQREIGMNKEGEKEEERRRRRDEKQWQAFIKSTQALRQKADPLEQLWVRSQACFEQPARAASAPRRTTGQISRGFVSIAGPVRGFDQIEGNHLDSDENYFGEDLFDRSGYRVQQSRSLGGHTQGGQSDCIPPSRPIRPLMEDPRILTQEEEHTVIRAIRYEQNYDLESMAARLRRPKEDVARFAKFLKQGYRESYTAKGVEIPTWAR